MTDTVEQKRNGYDDDDFRQILTEIEDIEDAMASIRAEAAGKCSAKSKEIERAVKRAKALGIPKSILNATRKTRKLERKIAEIAENIEADEVELFEDAIGQFSFLKPARGEGASSPAEVAVSRARTAAEENADQEQQEGEAVLNELTGAVH